MCGRPEWLEGLAGTGRRSALLWGVVCLALAAPATGQPAERGRDSTHYFPGRWDWATRTAGQAGFDAEKLAAAIAFAKENETRGVFAQVASSRLQRLDH